MYKILLVMILICCSLTAVEEYKVLPVAYKGRFIPLDVYAGNFLQEFYGKEKIKKSHLSQFDVPTRDALPFFLKFYFLGSKPFNDAPLFRISHAEIKKLLSLNLKEDHFSYNELKPALEKIGSSNFLKMQEKNHENAANTLILQLSDFGAWNGAIAKDLKLSLDETPLMSQLQDLGLKFLALPTKKLGNWVSLHALKIQIKDKNDGLKAISNFTPYKDESFNALRNAYFELEQAYIDQDLPDIDKGLKALGKALNEPYAAIAKNSALQAFQKNYRYPTYLQLKAEYYYTNYPLIEGAIFLYAIALIGFLLAKTLKNSKIKLLSIVIFSAGFILHTFILALRCYILERPPVSNMFETVIYVPWIAIIAGIIFYCMTKNAQLLIASCFSALTLLILLEVTNLNRQLEQPQAVLDSQYWLTVHVLLIVGSYGIFCLSGILGHIYLGFSLFNKKDTNEMKAVADSVLKTMYVGCFMLIPGTILGGVWAAESWGRFWDWDPKESWAFISCCIYMIFIHAHRFNKIKAFGLCVGSIVGLMAISFTWYGVNYILGTGLHSYGFGSGGANYYYFFLIAELSFLTIVFIKHKNIALPKRVEM